MLASVMSAISHGDSFGIITQKSVPPPRISRTSSCPILRNPVTTLKQVARTRTQWGNKALPCSKNSWKSQEKVADATMHMAKRAHTTMQDSRSKPLRSSSGTSRITCRNVCINLVREASEHISESERPSPIGSPSFLSLLSMQEGIAEAERPLAAVLTPTPSRHVAREVTTELEHVTPSTPSRSFRLPSTDGSALTWFDVSDVMASDHDFMPAENDDISCRFVCPPMADDALPSPPTLTSLLRALQPDLPRTSPPSGLGPSPRPTDLPVPRTHDAGLAANASPSRLAVDFDFDSDSTSSASPRLESVPSLQTPGTTLAFIPLALASPPPSFVFTPEALPAFPIPPNVAKSFSGRPEPSLAALDSFFSLVAATTPFSLSSFLPSVAPTPSCPSTSVFNTTCVPLPPASSVYDPFPLNPPLPRPAPTLSALSGRPSAFAPVASAPRVIAPTPTSTARGDALHLHSTGASAGIGLPCDRSKGPIVSFEHQTTTQSSPLVGLSRQGADEQQYVDACLALPSENSPHNRPEDIDPGCDCTSNSEAWAVCRDWLDGVYGDVDLDDVIVRIWSSMGTEPPPKRPRLSDDQSPRTYAS